MSDWTEIEVTTGVVRVCPKTGVIEARETVVPPNEVAVTASLRTTPAQRNALARALDPEHYARHDAIMASAKAVVDVVNGPADSRWLTSLAVTARLLGITLDDEEAIQ